jgi:hypothetical protein
MKDGEVVDSQNTGVITPYSPEYKDLEPNYALLETLAAETGGRYRPEREEIAIHNAANVWQLRDLWRLLVIVSIPLFFLDVALRRITISKEQISELRDRIHRSRNGETPATEANTLLTNLRRRKEETFDVHAFIRETQDAKRKTQDIREEQEASSLESGVLGLESSDAYTSRLLKAKRRAKTRS